VSRAKCFAISSHRFDCSTKFKARRIKPAGFFGCRVIRTMRGEDDLEGLPLQYGGPIALSPLGARCRRPRLHPHQVGVAWPLTRGRGIPTVAIGFGHRVLKTARNAAGFEKGSKRMVRQKGGQPGKQNAVTHGRYSRSTRAKHAAVFEARRARERAWLRDNPAPKNVPGKSG
jgi:hypothetical protein